MNVRFKSEFGKPENPASAGSIADARNLRRGPDPLELNLGKSNHADMELLKRLGW
jgi:hypothetical protein